MNGSPVLFRVRAPAKLQALQAKWLGHDVSLSFDAATSTWFGLAGVSLETGPGDYVLDLAGDPAVSQVPLGFQKKIHVFHAKRAAVQVSVPKKYVEPDPKQLELIKQDQALKQEVFSRTTAEREWDGRFTPPVQSQVSDLFGTERRFNGAVQSVHQGLDFRASEGTPVHAVNAGTVILAQPLYFEGNCVVVDHGQGLLTLYLHLSRIDVKQGDAIARGQEIGLSGATGRASGPHLHLAVRWQGSYLDPAILFRLSLP